MGKSHGDGTEVNPKLVERPETWVTARPLSHDGDVLYLLNIVDGTERIGVVCVCFWDETAMGLPDTPQEVRRAAKELMEDYGLDRIVCEVPVGDGMARNLARRIGLNEVGVVRQRKDVHGVRRDVVAMDLLPEDMEN